VIRFLSGFYSFCLCLHISYCLSLWRINVHIAANSLTYAIFSLNEMVAVHFIKIYCLPSMVYHCETWTINRSNIGTLDIAWNNAFRKTFNRFWRECQTTVTVILLLVTSYFHSVAYVNITFWQKVFYGNNLLLNVLITCCRENAVANADAHKMSLFDLLHLNSSCLKSMYVLGLFYWYHAFIMIF